MWKFPEDVSYMSTPPADSNATVAIESVEVCLTDLNFTDFHQEFDACVRFTKSLDTVISNLPVVSESVIMVLQPLT